MLVQGSYFFFFFFNDTATTEIYTLSLHDALPTSRESSRSTGCRPKDFVSPWTLIMRARPRSLEDRPHEVVPDENQDRGEDDRRRRRPRHALGAVADVEPLVGADPRHDDAEREGLPEPRHDVVQIDERLHLPEVCPRREA